MPKTPPLRRLLVLLALALVAACGDSTGPGRGLVDETELTFLRFAAGAPPLADTTISFWAKRGENTDVRIRTGDDDDDDDDDDDGGDDDGDDLLRFRIPGDGLFRYPDGRAFQRGDSVRITITVVDPARFVFRFEPAGLQFARGKEAELEVSYRDADDDFDGDGTVGDDDDDRIGRDFAVWRQERVGQPWERIATARLDDLEEVRAELSGFTRYALASN